MSKVLFLHGRSGIADAARDAGVAALWVDADGQAQASPSMQQHVLWWRDR